MTTNTTLYVQQSARNM